MRRRFDIYVTEMLQIFNRDNADIGQICDRNETEMMQICDRDYVYM